MTLVIGAVLLVAAVVVYLVQPMASGLHASLSREEDEPTELESRRRVALLALRDVEYDRATGKLGQEDYRALRRELSAEALDVLATVEAEISLGADASPLEQEIARLRGGFESGSTCGACGSANEAASRFCAYCGSPLRTAARGGASPDGSDGDRAPRPGPA